jgi:transposase-like protein
VRWRSPDIPSDPAASPSRAQPATEADPPPAAQAVAILESARRGLLACPRCQSKLLHRNGHANGLQRFRCRVCQRTFNSLTGTPLARLRHKGKWLDYCATLLDPTTTVRRGADRVAVHRNTSFRWRHRMLELTKLDRPLPLRGVVEAGAIHLPESHKGQRLPSDPAAHQQEPACRVRGQVCVITARDQSGRTYDAVTGTAPQNVARLVEQLVAALAPDALLRTTHHEAFRRFAPARAMRHEEVGTATDSGEPPLRDLHDYLSRRRSWLHHFRGVATRYLANYCGWRWAIDGQRIPSPQAFLRRAVGAFDRRTLPQRTVTAPCGATAGRTGWRALRRVAAAAVGIEQDPLDDVGIDVVGLEVFERRERIAARLQCNGAVDDAAPPGVPALADGRRQGDGIGRVGGSVHSTHSSLKC